MSDYYPDRWVVINIIPDKELHPESQQHYRVFASWNGGFVSGDSWRMNSGIESVEEDDEFFHFFGTSGSVYHCRKGNYGLNFYANNVLNSTIKKSEGLVIDVLPKECNFMTDIINQQTA